jgi:hypothetical protein
MKKYNVWLVVEAIDEARDDNGKDINCRKVFESKDREEAERFIEDCVVVIA